MKDKNIFEKAKKEISNESLINSKKGIKKNYKAGIEYYNDLKNHQNNT